MQMPSIAAMTGLAQSSIARISVCSVGSALALGVLNSRMSAPPEKRPPAPVMTMASQRGIVGRAVDPGDDVGAGRMPEAVDGRIVQRDDGHAAVQFVAGADDRLPFIPRAIPCARRDCRAIRARCLRTRCVPAPSRTSRCEIASAIVSFCSISRIATPRAAICSSSRRTCSTSRGARPSVGSSIMTRSGSPISVRQIVSICCSPPESTPPGASARSRSTGNSANTSSNDQRPDRPERLHAEQQILADGERRKDLAILRHVTQAPARDLVRLEPVDARALEAHASHRRAPAP